MQSPSRHVGVDRIEIPLTDDLSATVQQCTAMYSNVQQHPIYPPYRQFSSMFLFLSNIRQTASSPLPSKISHHAHTPPAKRLLLAMFSNSLRRFPKHTSIYIFFSINIDEQRTQLHRHLIVRERVCSGAVQLSLPARQSVVTGCPSPLITSTLVRRRHREPLHHRFLLLLLSISAFAIPAAPLLRLLLLLLQRLLLLYGCCYSDFPRCICYPPLLLPGIKHDNTQKASILTTTLSFHTRLFFFSQLSRPIPNWFRMKADNKIQYNAKRRHWRRTKLNI